MRRARRLLLSLLPLLAACSELPLPPELEAGGEPGPAIHTATGTFGSEAYRARGSATYTLDDAGHAALSLSTDFAIPAVPRVSIFLTDTGRLADAVKVGELTAASGAQRWTFMVPRGAVWRYALLWSEELWVEVSRARLEP
jgi:hypothetical protein